MDKPTLYRHLQADYERRHYGKPCDHCGRPIGEGSYSTHERDSDVSVEKFCSKLCMIEDCRDEDH